MRLKVDENLPIDVAVVLRQWAHDAVTVLEQGIGGCDDASLATHCRQEGRILVTLDMDFADIRSYPPAESPGLIVLRLRQHRRGRRRSTKCLRYTPQDKPHVLDSLSRLIPVFGQESLEGRLCIVEENRIRIRGESEER